MALTKTDFILYIFNEPVINAVITQLKRFDFNRHGGCLWLDNIRIEKKSIHLITAIMDPIDPYVSYARDIRIVLDSSDTITLKEFTTELKMCDLHLEDEFPYYQISDKELERICEASSIQIIGYDGNERVFDVTGSPSAFRAYYSVIVDERKYINPYHGLSPSYATFGRWLSGRITSFRIK